MNTKSSTAIALLALAMFLTTTGASASGPGRGPHTFAPLPVPHGSLEVNVANGNLLVQASDVDFASITDPSFAVSRSYNSLRSAEARDLGYGWTLAPGADIALRIASDAVTWLDPTGADVRFTRGDGGGFVAPDWFDGSLVATANGYSITLSANGTTRQYDFDAQGLLTLESNGSSSRLAVDYTSAAGQTRTSSWAEPNGRATRPSYNGDGSIIEIDDPASQHFYYDYVGRQLRAFRAPTGRTAYAYSPADRLMRVEYPSGDIATVDYDSQGRVRQTSLTPSGASAASAVRVFSYGPPDATCAATAVGTTTVTVDGASSSALYCWDADARVVGSSVDSSIDLGDGDQADCSSDQLGDEQPTPDYCGDQDSEEIASWPDADEESAAPTARSAPAAAAAAPVTNVPRTFAYGLGDQKARTFADSQFQQLPVQVVRLIVPYDLAAEGGRRLDAAVAWMRGALVKDSSGNQRYTPLISFEHCSNENLSINPATGQVFEDNPAINSGGDDRFCARAANRPSTLEYIAAVKRLIDYVDPRYVDETSTPGTAKPFAMVKLFTAWNEPNLTGVQPTADTAPSLASATVRNSGAVQAGRYWLYLRNYCSNPGGTPRCIAGAGDFLDSDLGNIYDSTRGRRYFDQYRKGMGNQPPQFWGWHPYRDIADTVPRLDIDSSLPNWGRLRSFLRATNINYTLSNPIYKARKQPPVLLTEGGSQYIRGSKLQPSPTAPLTEAEGDQEIRNFAVTAPVVTTGSGAPKRVKAVVPYQFTGDATDDYGFLRLDGVTPRPQYFTYCAVLGGTC